MKIYIQFFLLIFLLSPKLFADELLLKNYNKLKNLLNNETITIEQFNSGIDNILVSSVDYQNVKELFKDSVISKEDYLKILENLITKVQPSPQNKTITTDKKTSTNTKEIEISLKIFSFFKFILIFLNDLTFALLKNLFDTSLINISLTLFCSILTISFSILLTLAFKDSGTLCPT